MARSLLGPVEERVKTDLRLPRELVAGVDVLTELLGIPRNAFYALATARLVIELSSLLEDVKKRRVMLEEVGQLFQKTLKAAKMRG